MLAKAADQENRASPTIPRQLPVFCCFLRVFLFSQASSDPASFPWKAVKVKEVDCVKLFDGDSEELKKALAIQNSTFVSLEPDEITRKARNCKQFIQDYGFITDSLTKQEMSFPIAYSLLLHKEAQQVSFLR